MLGEEEDIIMSVNLIYNLLTYKLEFKLKTKILKNLEAPLRLIVIIIVNDKIHVIFL